MIQTFLETYILPMNASTNITGFFSLFQYVNTDLSHGLFAVLLMFAIAIVIFIALKDTAKSSAAFLTAAFFNVVIAIIFRTLGVISNSWMYISIIFLGFGFVWNHIDNKKVGL